MASEYFWMLQNIFEIFRIFPKATKYVFPIVAESFKKLLNALQIFELVFFKAIN